ncbi:MAG: exodeoxyribonuclease VII large subunit [Salinivirgaceae bacterium]|nr:MAG: exodeoxyribonuclease VII large subunit [Salinivirgaceae bacterium]
MEYNGITLSQLNLQIRETIEERFDEELWVIAEVSELNLNSKGHCYVDFIERDELTKKIVARQRATIWAFQYRLISGYFETTTGQELEAGMKVLVKVRVNYHVLYGFSLNVVDIDPTYTLGEQARHREEIIRRLEEEGVFDMNRELVLVHVPQRLAIISSETAAGFGDFVNHLELNEFGYHIHWELFAASMQGDQTSVSVVEALTRVFEREEDFDAILIIRGGGAKAELAAFDDYDIAFMVTQSPIPVLTGIGHERDESVTDMVAWRAFKTPTAVANFVIDQFAEFETNIDELGRSLERRVLHLLDNQKAKLSELNLSVQSASQLLLKEARYSLQHYAGKLQYGAVGYINQLQEMLTDLNRKSRYVLSHQFVEKGMELNKLESKIAFGVKRVYTEKYHQLAILSEKALQNDPKKLLQSGYGYVTKEGKRITAINELQKDDAIKIAFTDGIANAIIKNTKKRI